MLKGQRDYAKGSIFKIKLWRAYKESEDWKNSTSFSRHNVVSGELLATALSNGLPDDPSDPGRKLHSGGRIGSQNFFCLERIR